MKSLRILACWLAALVSTAWLPAVLAQTTNVVSDSFNGTSTAINWIASKGACLTAGTAKTVTGTVPACSGLAYYGTQNQAGLANGPDASGSGALRLTNGCYYPNNDITKTPTCVGYESGAIISNTPFSSNQGVQVTFTTYTYSGNRGGTAGDGADGIGFYLFDASKVATSGGNYAPQIGATGGSLGYSCSNTNYPYDGMVGAYLGLGIDEYGNFLNNGDNTNTGAQATTSNGGNGVQYQPGRIGLRGYGGVYLSALQAYNANASEADVLATCRNGGTYTYGTTNTTTYTNTSTYQAGSNYTPLTTTTYVYTTNLSQNNFSYSTAQNACTNNQPANTSSGGAGTPTGLPITVPAGTPLYQQSSSTTSQTVTGTKTYPVLLGLLGSYTCNTSTTTATTTYSYTQPSSSTGVPSATIASTTGSTNTGWYGTGTPFALINGNYYPVTITTTSATSTSVNQATFPDYAAIPNAFVNLPSTQPIAAESATTRSAAVPISYKLQITQTGLLSLSYSYNGGTYVPVLTNQNISNSNGSMPASFLFGFGASTGGSQNVHEITCFQAAAANSSASSAGINTQQTGQVQTGTQVYTAYYHPNNWWGQLTAQNIVINVDGSISIASGANWDASCVLTGGACASTGGTSTAQGPSSRNMVTWTGGPNDNASSAGAAPFTWSRLTTNEQAWLGSNDSGVSGASAIAQDRVAYLQGDRTNEITSTGNSASKNSSGVYDNFRVRTGVLGDIIDSSPTWVGPPASPYPNTWSDLLYPSATPSENAAAATNYGTFASNEATRLNVVYVGANDGFMHGFEAGYYNANGSYACGISATNTSCTTGTAGNDGKEVLAYIPGAVLSTIHNASNSALDYSSGNYGHNFYVDSTPGTGDLFYSNKWHTWLVSGLGAGGNGIFALDITDLGTTPFGTSNVIGEWSTAVATTAGVKSATSTLNCINVSNCGAAMGQTTGTPLIRRLHNGQWAVIFGNGLNSVTGHAGIFVMLVNSSGVISASSAASSSVYFLDTGVGSAANPDGISYVSSVDLDGDHIADYIYGGDTYGNVWRFDLTSNTPGNWAVSTYGNASATPLFTTPPVKTVYTVTTANGSTTTSTPTITYLPPVAPAQQATYNYSTTSSTSGNTTTYTVISPQPITTAVTVVSATEPAANNNTPYLLAEFGTGSISAQSIASSATYAAGPQSMYGIWDWNMGVSKTAGANYAGLTAGGTGAPTSTSPITLSALTQQSIASTTTVASSASLPISGYRTVTNNTLCMVGTTCTTINSSGQAATAAGNVYGWYLPLTGFTGVNWVGGTNQTEQVIYSPTESSGYLLFNTTIPANNSPLTCSANAASGWTMALNPATGGASTALYQSYSGVAIGGVGSVSVVTVNGNPVVITQTPTQATAVPIQKQSQTGSRMTWLQLH